jgi:hypothetical protein
MFLDAYGLEDREGFVDDIIARINVAVRPFDAAVQAGDHGARPFVELLEGDLEFIRRNRGALEQCDASAAGAGDLVAVG